MTKFLHLSETSDWNTNMIFIDYFFFQIDDTDAMEDVHSLLTDVPPPSGTYFSNLYCRLQNDKIELVLF